MEGRPHAALTLGPSGRLYGTAQAGGTIGLGVVFRVSGTGEETVIHSFQGDVSDGALPMTGVILDSEGNLYGTTETGGSNYQGVAYKIDNTGTETILHAFSGGADGGSPMSGLTQDAAGNLYGTTSFGGTGFAGVVYKISPSGQ